MGSTWILASYPCSVPSPGSNSERWRSNTCATVLLCTVLISLQLSRISMSQSRPIRHGPSPATTSKGSFARCCNTPPPLPAPVLVSAHQNTCVTGRSSAVGWILQTYSCVSSRRLVTQQHQYQPPFVVAFPRSSSPLLEVGLTQS